ncbi:MAG: methyltransferase domain-containing protein [Chromatiales bacterium]|nr:methyltransferase domain-containing protein [Chromatiales bacterium]
MKHRQAGIMAIFSIENGFGEDRVLEWGNGGTFFYNDFQRARLNARHRVILEPLRGEIEGRTVLDLASHDGRWSFAALMLGARHVVGIECRQELIDFRSPAFSAMDQSRYQFIRGDVFDVLPELVRERQRFDVILNLGLFYHVMDHYLMLKLMRELSPTMIVLDTVLIDSEDAFIKLEMEPTESILNAIENKYGQPENIVGLASKGGLNLMARSLGMNCSPIDWNAAVFSDLRGVNDYFSMGRDGRRRFSLVLRPQEPPAT